MCLLFPRLVGKTIANIGVLAALPVAYCATVVIGMPAFTEMAGYPFPNQLTYAPEWRFLGILTLQWEYLKNVQHIYNFMDYFYRNTYNVIMGSLGIVNPKQVGAMPYSFALAAVGLTGVVLIFGFAWALLRSRLRHWRCGRGARDVSRVTGNPASRGAES